MSGDEATEPVEATTEPPTRSSRARVARQAALWSAAVLAGLLLLLGIFLALPYGPAAAIARPILALLSTGPGLPGDLDDRPAERSVVLAADGAEIAVLAGDENRIRVDLEEVPEVARQAVLAIEDDDFHEHRGIDHRAILRAAFVNLRAGGVAEGGSTITQQYVKNVYLSADRTLQRKTTEAHYALDLERRLTKDEILERYLNETYFGKGVYGIATAAEYYFSAEIGELDLSRSALLAGLIAAPERRNPIEDPEGADARREIVLDRMVDEGFIDRAQADAAGPPELALSPLPPPESPFFVEWVTQQLLADERLDEDDETRARLVYEGGLEIRTTLDSGLQAAAESAIADTLAAPETDPQATLVSVQPGSGAIVALAVGPREFGLCPDDEPECPRTQVNPAVPGLGGSGRQPGSAFKPFAIGAALEAGMPVGWQEETADGVEIPGCDDGGEAYVPSNFDSGDGGVRNMYEAVAVSNNVYHAKLAGIVEPEPIAAFAERSGLRTAELPRECSLALGAGSTYPTEMAAAYATFAEAGTYCEPYAISEVRRGEETLFEHESSCTSVMDAEIAAQVTDILRGPVAEGTAAAAQLDRPVAGKTGTTQDYHDAWFVGYVAQLSTAAWMGYEQPQPMRDIAGVDAVTGGSLPAQMWAAYMAEATADLEPEDFPAPAAAEQRTVPDLEGTDAGQVEEAIGRFDFNVRSVSVEDYRPSGMIVSQEPDPGSEVPRGTMLTIEVSDGTGTPPEVPDVVGLPEDDAVEALAEAEYEVEVVEDRRTVELPADDEQEAEDLDPAEGTVIAQEPEAGTPLEPGETVVITVVRYDIEREEPPESPEPSPSPSPEEEDGEPDEDD